MAYIQIAPIFAILFLGLVLEPANCDPYPWAENVCNTSIPVKMDIKYIKPVEYELKVDSMCGILPCQKVRKHKGMDESIRTVIRQETQSSCCPGYAETPDRRCAPICLRSCINGKCAAPNTCKCQPEPSLSTPGFVGPTCARFVCMDDNKWGSLCERECNCSANSYCSADTGKCLCYPGWRGANCTLECDADSKECGEYNRLPEIVEPDANLMTSENLLLSRQKSEALVLDDDVRVTADEGRDPSTSAPTYLVAILSLVSLVLLISFLVVKRRYEQVRAELYYGPTGSQPSERNYSSSSKPSYYTTEGASIGSDDTNAMFDKHYSFAEATRNIILGRGADTPTSHGQERDKIMFNPRFEANLIASQEATQQNLYSDIVLNMGSVNPIPPPLPPRNSQAQSVEDHIYQVPKTSSGDSTGRVENSTEMSSDYVRDDDSANIYEVPRK